MAQVRNITQGGRGAYLNGLLVMAEPGQTIDADDFADEWFEEVGEADLTKMKVAELKSFAEQNGIDLGDATSKADIISAIELALEA